MRLVDLISAKTSQHYHQSQAPNVSRAVEMMSVGRMPRAFNYYVRRQARAVGRSQGDQRVLANIALFVVDGGYASWTGERS